MKVLMTGATSFLGNYIRSELMRHGHEVITIGRSDARHWELGKPIPFTQQADVLLHLAHDRRRNLEQNFRDIWEIRNSFAGQIIYISTLSAHRNTISEYGKSKYVAEDVVLQSGGTVIKVGLVTHPLAEGIYGKVRSLVRKFPIIPLPLLGNSNFYISKIEDLSSEINFLVERHKPGIIRGFCASPLDFKELIWVLSNELRVKRFVIPLPKYPLHIAILLLKRVAPQLPLLDSYFSLVCEMSDEERKGMLDPKTNFERVK